MFYSKYLVVVDSSAYFTYNNCQNNVKTYDRVYTFSTRNVITLECEKKVNFAENEEILSDDKRTRSRENNVACVQQ